MEADVTIPIFKQGSMETEKKMYFNVWWSDVIVYLMIPIFKGGSMEAKKNDGDRRYRKNWGWMCCPGSKKNKVKKYKNFPDL